MNCKIRLPGALLVALCTALPAAPALAGHTLFPGELKASVRRMHAAALSHDFTVLRAGMSHEFRLNFDEDTSADHALAVWKNDPAQLQTLAEATKGACEWETRESVTCPAGKESVRYRATFSKSSGRWKMSGFVINE